MSPNVNNNLNSSTINSGALGYQKDDSGAELNQMSSRLKDMTLNAVSKYQDMSGAANGASMTNEANYQLPSNIKVSGLTVNVTR